MIGPCRQQVSGRINSHRPTYHFQLCALHSHNSHPVLMVHASQAVQDSYPFKRFYMGGTRTLPLVFSILLDVRHISLTYTGHHGQDRNFLNPRYELTTPRQLLRKSHPERYWVCVCQWVNTGLFQTKWPHSLLTTSSQAPSCHPSPLFFDVAPQCTTRIKSSVQLRELLILSMIVSPCSVSSTRPPLATSHRGN